MRNEEYGICQKCKKYNTGNCLCHSCDSQIMDQKWESGSKEINDFIRKSQLKAYDYLKVIEWIPFERLENINTIGKGGFGIVYSANWVDGKRTKSVAIKKFGFEYTVSRDKFCMIALKRLKNQNVSDIFKEFKTQVDCQLKGSHLEICGITQDTTTKEYMIVTQYADKGNLHQYLSNNFVTWRQKLWFLVTIADDLKNIHSAGYIHGDLHPGNILQVCYKRSSNVDSYISDMGMSKKIDESDKSDRIFGVVPYIAPEVYLDNKFTTASDIYSFGVIMSEMTTGKLSFENRLHDINLQLDIINGLRPEFAPTTPKFYTQFAMLCMDSNSCSRPTATYIYNKLLSWWCITSRNPKCLNKKEFKIYSAFLKADTEILDSSTNSNRHPKAIYTSRFINTQDILKILKVRSNNLISDSFNISDKNENENDSLNLQNKKTVKKDFSSNSQELLQLWENFLFSSE